MPLTPAGNHAADPEGMWSRRIIRWVTTAAALTGFYEFHAGRGVGVIEDITRWGRIARRNYKPFSPSRPWYGSRNDEAQCTPSSAWSATIESTSRVAQAAVHVRTQRSAAC